MKKRQITNNSGVTLLELLGYVLAFAIVINLALSLFLDSTRLNALGVEVLDKIGQTEEIRREFQEAVRECSSVCKQAGTFETGADQLVLQTQPDSAEGEQARYVIFQTVQSPKRLRKIVIAEKNGNLDTLSVVTYPLEVDLVKFAYDKGKLVSLDMTLKKISDRVKKESTVHRFTSYMRGVQS